MSARLAQFMAARAAETYPEPISEGHSHITEKIMPLVMAHVPPGEVLDVGCGQGPALRLFEQHGRKARGISLNFEDVSICNHDGFDVRLCDQNDMPEDFTGMFALVWARHVLEHSVAPLWTLHEFNRVLAPGGVLYAEMPSPSTSCHHESNLNHYSVLGLEAWTQLITRAGFTILETRTIAIQTGAGPDTYLSFIAKKA